MLNRRDVVRVSLLEGLQCQVEDETADRQPNAPSKGWWWRHWCELEQMRLDG